MLLVYVERFSIKKTYSYWGIGMKAHPTHVHPILILLKSPPLLKTQAERVGVEMKTFASHVSSKRGVHGG